MNNHCYSLFSGHCTILTFNTGMEVENVKSEILAKGFSLIVPAEKSLKGKEDIGFKLYCQFCNFSAEILYRVIISSELFKEDGYIIKLVFSRFVRGIIPHSHQNLSCLRSDVSNFLAVSLSVNRGQLAPLLRQLMFWCECGIRKPVLDQLLVCRLPQISIIL